MTSLTITIDFDEADSATPEDFAVLSPQVHSLIILRMPAICREKTGKKAKREEAEKLFKRERSDETH